ncbi:MAG: acetyl-CoA C-acetyltransferase, partial [Schleiferiaceae bacterium]|nr:acetyl-CoA C-acetyltransferase [Schleiferiaceae bacterium]
MKEVVIVSAVRTPMGSFGGSLSSVAATKLGAAAIKGAIDKINLDANLIDEVYMGNVLQANNGQAPARQAAIYAGLSKETPCTTVNKVCSSGMKSIMLGAQAIKSGDAEVVVVGGMENMSAVPHYLPTSRNGQKLGDIKMVDGLVKDGLTDVFNQVHMGSCAEICADDMNFTREQQDAFALESYRRSTEAWSQGNFADEIVPVEVPQRRGDALIINEDEEYKNLRA